MRPSGSAALVLLATLALGGCATGSPGSAGSGLGEPVVSPTGVVFPPGTPPTETRFSQTATLYLQRGRLERALELAEQGLEADSANPIHHFLAGVAHARLGHYRSADRRFSEAERIYPAYELRTEPERRSAWAEAFNQGVEAYAAGEAEAAIEAWKRAVRVYDRRPEAHRNLASVLVGRGRYGEAVEVYRQAIAGLRRQPVTEVLGEEELREREETRVRMKTSLARILQFRKRFAEAEPLLRDLLSRTPGDVELRLQLARAVGGQGRKEEATEIYASLLSERDLESGDLFDVGVALFRSQRYANAAEAFDRLTRLRPHSRDAWFNYANALLASEAWQKLTAVGERLVALDPLSEDAGLIAARAHVEAGEREAAARRMKELEAAPVYLDALQMTPSRDGTQVQGRVVGNRAEPGTPVRLRFSFYRDGEAVGSEVVTVSAPPRDETAALEVATGARATGYRYEVIER